MNDSTPALLTSPDAAKQPADPYRTVTVSEKIRFGITVAAESLGEQADFARLLAEGIYPENYRNFLELILKLVPPGGAVIDVGANIGVISLALAAAGCRVLAIEAAPRNAILLQTSVDRNGFRQMRVVNAAVSDQPGTLEFLPCGPWGVVSTPELKESTGRPSVKVPAVTVDELLTSVGWENVDFIKLDIEGSEIPALRGMAHLLGRSDAPPILYESCGYTQGLYGRTTRQLKSVLEEFGYRNYLVGPGRLIPVQASDVQPDCVADYLAVKTMPAALAGWVSGEPARGLTREEIVTRFLATCEEVDKIWGVREHVLGEVKNAPSWFLATEVVRQALGSLSIEGFDPFPMYSARIVHEKSRLSRHRALKLVVQNTGTTAWSREWPIEVRVAGNAPSRHYHPSWISPSRVCHMVENRVPPEKNATFWFRAMPGPSREEELFQLAVGQFLFPGTEFRINPYWHPMDLGRDVWSFLNAGKRWVKRLIASRK